MVVHAPSRMAHYRDGAEGGTLQAVARRVALGQGVRVIWLRRKATEVVLDSVCAAKLNLGTHRTRAGAMGRKRWAFPS
jgi:hypothetical protein